MARLGRYQPNRPIVRRGFHGDLPVGPTVRSVGSYVSLASETTAVAPLPTGWQAGDVCYLFATNRASGGGFTTTPSGWAVLQASFDSANTTSSHMVAYRRVLQGGDTDPTLTGFSGRFAALSVAVQDASTTTPEDTGVANDPGQVGQQAAIVCPSVTPANANSLLLCGFGSGGPNGTTWTVAEPGGMTEVGDICTAVAAVTETAVQVSSLALATTDPTGTKTATASVSNIAQMGVTVAVRWSGAAGGATGAAVSAQRTSGVTAGAKGTAGAAQGQTRGSGQAAGAKNAAGAAQGPARATGVAATRKQATGATAGATRSSGVSATRKQATGATAGASRSSGQTTGIKGGVGAQTGQQRTDGLAGFTPAGPAGAQTGLQRTSGVTAGAKATTGAASGRTRTSGTTTGRKQITGAATGAQRTADQSAAAKQATGAASGQQRTAGVVVSALFVGPNGPARGSQRTAGRTTGIKGGLAAEAGQQRTSGVTAGIHRTTGAASGRQRTSGQTAAVRGARGAQTGQQRTDGHAAFTTVPAPRWVEGATSGTGQTEGTSSGTDQIEGVLVGAGLVEGSGGV